MAMSHRDCDHPATATARKACRQRQTHLSVVAAPFTPRPVPVQAPRNTPRSPVKTRSRTNPMSVTRDPQRAADGRDYSSCVQSVLHRGTGRCACGWSA